MANIKNLNTTHLLHGRAIPDPIATAKATGKHYSGTTKHNEIHQTPDSLRPVDGHLADDHTDRGPMLHRPMDAVTARHTYTGSGGSKRDD
jgi:hypothetical protein